MSRKQVLFISHDIVGARMAGPGIRYYHLAQALSQEFEVILAVPSKLPSDMVRADFCTVQYTRRDWGSIAPILDMAETAILPSDIASEFPQLIDSNTYLVIDGYDPLMAEWLALNKNRPPQKTEKPWKQRMEDLTTQYLLGDFFICASERQRDWWLGLLEANGRFNPHTFGEDPSLRALIDVVPYGLPDTTPQMSKPVIRDVWSEIDDNDRVVLWGGGLWPWLDPLTAIEAVAKVWKRRQDIRLIFPGTKHPNPNMKGIPTHNESAYELAREKGLLDKVIFFGDWVPYADWPSVLLESDIALTLHYDTLETRLAFRSRVLDYIWAGLPTVATRGDATSDIVSQYGLGAIVDYEDADGVAAAVLRLLETPGEQFKSGFNSARLKLTWEQAARPLVEFCRRPRKAPDKIALHGQIGNPYYLEKQKYLNAEKKKLRKLVNEYEQGRFIRLMRWLDRVRNEFLRSIS